MRWEGRRREGGRRGRREGGRTKKSWKKSEAVAGGGGGRGREGPGDEAGGSGPTKRPRGRCSLALAKRCTTREWRRRRFPFSSRPWPSTRPTVSWHSRKERRRRRSSSRPCKETKGRGKGRRRG